MMHLLLPCIACIVWATSGGGTSPPPPDPFRGNERSREEHRMLMEYELRKYRLQEGGEAVGGGGVSGDLFVVRADDTEELRRMCREHGLSYVRKVFEDENFVLLQRKDGDERRRRRAEDGLRGFGQRSEQIPWTLSRQTPKERVLRVMADDWPIDGQRLMAEIENLSHQERPRHSYPEFNDPLFKKQWYLHNFGQTGSPPGVDVRVVPVWRSGITGRGVTISVLDDGVDGTNEEVADNYDSAISDSFLFRKTGLHPVPRNSHGTRCAAVAAGVANNSVCGVGVAYGARVGGVRLLDGPLTDAQEALSLSRGPVDVYTASWGPDDRGQALDGPDILARMALVKGVTQGRRGLGSVYVWASGNGGAYGDACSLDGYASSPFTVAVGALTEGGRSAFYSEPCPAVAAALPVGGRAHLTPTDAGAWEEDKRRTKVVVPEGRGKCRETFQGTSAAAPLAAGIVALALQANPDLTWRDVLHLIIRTSRVPLPPEPGWTRNGAGFHFHPKMGSGLMDARALVAMARRWTPVRRLRLWTTGGGARNSGLLPPRKTSSVPLPIRGSSIDRLETVIATVSLRHVRRGCLGIALRSPSGTLSRFATRRPRDNATSGFQYWDFVSLHFWGEDPEGSWTLKIANHHETAEGFLDHFSLTLHGTDSRD